VADIIAALKAIPYLVDLLKSIAKYLNKQFGDNPAKFLIDSSLAFKDLEQANTKEKKLEAAKKIQELISRL